MYYPHAAKALWREPQFRKSVFIFQVSQFLFQNLILLLNKGRFFPLTMYYLQSAKKLFCEN